MAKPTSDSPDQAKDRSLDAGDSNKTRQILTAESQERTAPSQTAERNRNGAFTLGVPKEKEPDLSGIFKKDPEFERRFFDMTGENGNVVERPLGGLFAPDSYRNQAFRQMMGKYGTERVKEAFAALEQMGKKAEWVGHGLRPDEPTFAEQNKKLDQATQERDNFSAKQIKQILDSNKDNKVVYWSGMMHGADTTSGAYRSTADILRNQKVAITTTMEQSSATPSDDLTYYAKHLDKPTAISTKKTPLIAGTEVPRLGNDVQERYGMWDSVLIFPPKRK